MKKALGIGVIALAGAAFAAAHGSSASAVGANTYCVVYENHDGMVVENVSADGFKVLGLGGPLAAVFYDDGQDIAAFFNLAKVSKGAC